MIIIKNIFGVQFKPHYYFIITKNNIIYDKEIIGGYIVNLFKMYSPLLFMSLNHYS